MDYWSIDYRKDLGGRNCFLGFFFIFGFVGPRSYKGPVI